MHRLQDIQHLLLMFITLHLRNATLASVKMAGLLDLFLSETDADIPHETRLQHVHKNVWRNNVPQ
jgi:hypothetical protein